MLPWNIHVHFLVFKEGERFALKTQKFTGMACSKVESLSLVSTTRCPGICSGIDIACAKTTHYVLFFILQFVRNFFNKKYSNAFEKKQPVYFSWDSIAYWTSKPFTNRKMLIWKIKTSGSSISSPQKQRSWIIQKKFLTEKIDLRNSTHPYSPEILQAMLYGWNAEGLKQGERKQTQD